ncbi:MAG: uL30 family ribosomal protein [Candidatus Aenigmatarchaeota archaeon]
MIAVIRIRGRIGVRKDINDTLKMLGLRKLNSMAILPRTDSIIGMIKKASDYVMWGEISDELSKKAKGMKPRPLKKKSIKERYPKGELGYRKDMEELLKKML